jgi:hypothetical protein
MAETATAEYYRKQNDLNKAKLKTDYEQYLEDLATKYNISGEQLNANLEARGILRSGEAGTAQARLGAANEAARTSAKTNYEYNTATADTNLMTQLAGLQAAAPAVTQPVAPPPVAPPPAGDKLPIDLSGVDFAALGRYMDSMNKPKTKPVVYGGGTTQGQLPQASLPTTKPGTTSFNPKPATTRITPPSARNR